MDLYSALTNDNPTQQLRHITYERINITVCTLQLSRWICIIALLDDVCIIMELDDFLYAYFCVL